MQCARVAFQSSSAGLRFASHNHGDGMNFDMKCYMYFRIEKGQGFYIEGSQGVYDVDKEEQQDFPPFGPD